MKSALIKDILREIWKSKNRFISIMAIVAIGTGFFAGIKAARPGMVETAQIYYSDYNLADLFIKGTMGFTQEDLELSLAANDALNARLGYSADLFFANKRSGANEIAKVISFDPNGREGYLNMPVLKDGRMPRNKNECVVDHLIGRGYAIGSTISLYLDGKEDIEKILSVFDFTIVGLVSSPEYVAFGRGRSNIGNGNVSAFMFICEEAFAYEAHTDLYVSFATSSNLNFYDALYKDYMKTQTAAFEAIGQERSPLRLKEIKDEAQIEINDAKKDLQDGYDEYYDGKDTFDKEISIAQAKISTARYELNEQVKLLAGLPATLAEAEEAYAQGLLAYQEGLAAFEEGIAEFEEGLAAYQEGKDQFEVGLATYNEGLAEYLENLVVYNQGLAVFEEEKAAALAALAGPQAIVAELEKVSAMIGEIQKLHLSPSTEQAELVETLASQIDYAVLSIALEMSTGPSVSIDILQTAIISAINGDAASLGMLGSTALMLEPSRQSIMGEIDAGMAALAAAQSELDTGKALLDEAKSQLDEGKKELDGSAAQLVETEQQLQEAWSAIQDAEEELVSGKEELDAAPEQLELLRKTIAEAPAMVAEAQKQIDEGQKKLDEERAKGLKTLAEALEKLEDGRIEIADAIKELEDLKEPKWYVMERKSSPGYSDFIDDTDKIDKVATVFPVFFILIAALVCSTTMARMVEEQRGQLGTLKTMGYTNREILSKYVAYALAASLSGCAIGLSIGYAVLPRVIFDAYKIMYIYPDLAQRVHWDYIAYCTAVSAIVTVSSACSVCLKELDSEPASLLRPKAPTIGSKIMLEKITPLWKRLGFLQKVTARNIFRYKKRIAMSVVGIAGSCALILAAYGLRHSINSIVERQYKDIFVYDVIGIFDDGLSYEQLEGLKKELIGISGMEEHMLARYAKFDVLKNDGAREDHFIIVPDEPEFFSTFIRLHERQSKQPVALSDEGVVITEKLSRILGAKEGSYITVFEDDIQTRVKVIGIVENYVMNYVYFTPSGYSQAFGKPAAYNAFYAKYSGERDRFSEEVLKIEDILALSFTASSGAQFSDMVASLSIIVGVIIAASGALSLVVLYNLATINISERIREIATIKVLGFTDWEVSSYINRENMASCFIGIVVGVLAGIPFERFIVETIEVNIVMFAPDLNAMSFVMAISLTMLFTLIVNIILHFTLMNVPMSESLKSVE
ncbi:MAG: FtsX-like permease family protein [Eubacteriaceae bacterium]|nr:FtsX-like permease family protein [Eubacteriaceae bacterium]